MATVGKPFKKGEGGRPKGVPNKLTKTVKETVLAAFNELQEDPLTNIVAWGKDNPTAFYQIAAKLIPTEVQGKLEVQSNKYIFETDGECDPVQD